MRTPPSSAPRIRPELISTTAPATGAAACASSRTATRGYAAAASVAPPNLRKPRRFMADTIYPHRHDALPLSSNLLLRRPGERLEFGSGGIAMRRRQLLALGTLGMLMA